jgi:hypothetical protein
MHDQMGDGNLRMGLHDAVNRRNVANFKSCHQASAAPEERASNAHHASAKRTQYVPPSGINASLKS